jgi:hypothetical protein
MNFETPKGGPLMKYRLVALASALMALFQVSGAVWRQ